MNTKFISRMNGHSNVLLQQQMKELVIRHRAEGKAEGVSEAIGMVTAAFVLQLHDKFDFSVAEIEQLLNDVNFTIDCILSGHVSFEDIQKEVEEIKITKKEVK